MNLVVLFAIFSVLNYLVAGIFLYMKLRENRRRKEIEKEIEKFEARRKIYLAILEDDEDALLAVMKKSKSLKLEERYI